MCRRVLRSGVGQVWGVRLLLVRCPRTGSGRRGGRGWAPAALGGSGSGEESRGMGPSVLPPLVLARDRTGSFPMPPPPGTWQWHQSHAIAPSYTSDAARPQPPKPSPHSGETYHQARARSTNTKTRTETGRRKRKRGDRRRRRMPHMTCVLIVRWQARLHLLLSNLTCTFTVVCQHTLACLLFPLSAHNFWMNRTCLLSSETARAWGPHARSCIT